MHATLESSCLTLRDGPLDKTLHEHADKRILSQRLGVRLGMTAREVGVCSLIALALIGCSRDNDRLTNHLDKAKQLYASGKWDKARLELKNVLQIDRKSPDAYYYTGLVDEKQGDLQSAYASFTTAIELDPSHYDASTRIGTYYLLDGDIRKADQSAEALLKERPYDSAGMVLKAATLALKGEREEALALAQRVLAADPSYPETYTVIAGLYAARKETDKAVVLLKEGIAHNPKATEPRLALAALMIREKSLDQAQAQFRQLVTIEPQRYSHWIALARLQVEQKDFEGAEQTLRDAIRVDSDDEQRRLTLIAFLMWRNQIDQAEKELISSVEANPDAYAMRFHLARFFRMRGRVDKALGTYEQIIQRDKLGPNGLRARIGVAQLKLAEHPEEARELTAFVLRHNPRDGGALTLRGDMALARGATLSAIADYRTVLVDQPDSPELSQRLAVAHMVNGESELAADILGTIAEKYPSNLAVRLLLAEAKIASGDQKGALQDVAVALKTEPKNRRALELQADLETTTKNWGAAERSVAELRQAYPTDAGAEYRAGVLYLAQGKPQTAVAAFESSLAMAPGAVEPVVGVVNAYLAQGKFDKVLARIDQAAATAPLAHAMQVLKGHVLARMGRLSEAESAFAQAVRIEPKLQVNHIELANFYLSTQRLGAAIQAVRAGLVAIPGNHALSHLLADLLRRSGDFEAAIRQYEAILRQQPADDLAANNLAAILLDARHDRPSFDRAMELAKHFESSGKPIYLDTLGWAWYRLGQYPQAISVLSKAEAELPESGGLQYHLGMALYKLGKVEDAHMHLRKALKGKDDFPGRAEAKSLVDASY